MSIAVANRISPHYLYSVQPGDTLAKIAAQFYGIDRAWGPIYDLNRTLIGDDPDRLPVGLELVIPPSEFQGYTVQQGDTLRAIAQRFYNDADRWSIIWESNRRLIGDNPHHLEPGRALLIPEASDVSVYSVQPGDTLSAIARHFYDNPNRWPSLYQHNRAIIGSDPHRLRAGIQLVIPPPPQPSLHRLQPLHSLRAHQNALTSLAVHPANDWFVTGSRDTFVRRWRIDGRPIGLPYPGDRGSVSAVAIEAGAGEPTQENLVSATFGGTVSISDAHNQTLHHFPGRDGSIYAMAINPLADPTTEGYLVTASHDGALRWFTRSGTLVKTATAHRTPISGLALGFGGTLLASASNDQQVHLWNRRGDLLTTLTEPDTQVAEMSVCIHPKRPWVLVGGGPTVKLLNCNGLSLRVLEQGSGVDDVDFHPGGRYLAVACWDGTVRLWDIHESAGPGKLLYTLSGHAEAASAVRFSASGQWLISGDRSGSLVIWQVEQSI